MHRRRRVGPFHHHLPPAPSSSVSTEEEDTPLCPISSSSSPTIGGDASEDALYAIVLQEFCRQIPHLHEQAIREQYANELHDVTKYVAYTILPSCTSWKESIRHRIIEEKVSSVIQTEGYRKLRNDPPVVDLAPVARMTHGLSAKKSHTKNRNSGGSSSSSSSRNSNTAAAATTKHSMDSIGKVTCWILQDAYTQHVDDDSSSGGDGGSSSDDSAVLLLQDGIGYSSSDDGGTIYEFDVDCATSNSTSSSSSSDITLDEDGTELSSLGSRFSFICTVTQGNNRKRQRVVSASSPTASPVDPPAVASTSSVLSRPCAVSARTIPFAHKVEPPACPTLAPSHRKKRKQRTGDLCHRIQRSQRGGGGNQQRVQSTPRVEYAREQMHGKRTKRNVRAKAVPPRSPRIRPRDGPSVRSREDPTHGWLNVEWEESEAVQHNAQRHEEEGVGNTCMPLVYLPLSEYTATESLYLVEQFAIHLQE